MSRLNFTPVNISVIVRENPPTSVAGVANIDCTILLRQHTFSVARYLINELGHTVLQDRFGEIWSQKTSYMVVPIGGRRIIIKDSNSEVDLEWLRAIVIKVRGLSRRTIATNVPYAMGVLAIYEGCAPSEIPKNRIPAYLSTSQAFRLKPVNAWMAFRTWFADGLKTRYIMGQSDVSRLAKICYRIVPINDLSNIATMYTHARNNCTLGDVCLSEFVKRELKNYGYTKNPLDMLEDCGVSLAAFEQRIPTV